MEFEEKKWDKFNYKPNYERKGIIGELTIKENKRVIDNISFRNNNEFRVMVSIMKKYGFSLGNNKEELKKEVEEEKKNLEKLKQKGFLEKDWEW